MCVFRQQVCQRISQTSLPRCVSLMRYRCGVCSRNAGEYLARFWTSLGVGLAAAVADISSGVRAARRRVFQHFRLSEPDVGVAAESRRRTLPPLVQTIEKLAVATVQFVDRPGHDADAVGDRAIDQVQRDLRFRLKLDVVGNVVFFGAPGRRPIPAEDTSGRPAGSEIRAWNTPARRC